MISVAKIKSVQRMKISWNIRGVLGSLLAYWIESDFWSYHIKWHCSHLFILSFWRNTSFILVPYLKLATWGTWISFLKACNKLWKFSDIEVSSSPITAQKMKFSLKNSFSKCDQISRKLRETVDLVTFTAEILNGRLHSWYNTAVKKQTILIERWLKKRTVYMRNEC